MQLLSSKNYDRVLVHLRDDETVAMPSPAGLRLMDYLTGDVQTKHVKLTDLDGMVSVVLITDIRKITPILAKEPIDESKYI